MGQLIATALSIAASMFGPTTCGTPHLYSERLPAQVVAVAIREDCSITYNSAVSLSRYDVCYATVHEYGHLAGLGHSPDPASIMYPIEQPGFEPCVEAAG